MWLDVARCAEISLLFCNDLLDKVAKRTHERMCQASGRIGCALGIKPFHWDMACPTLRRLNDGHGVFLLAWQVSVHRMPTVSRPPDFGDIKFSKGKSNRPRIGAAVRTFVERVTGQTATVIV